MKKIFLLTTIGALALTSCSHDFGDYDGSIRKPSKEEINKNIAEIFGSIDPNQDWNVHSSGTVSITANAPLHDIVEVQILTGSPFFNSECSIVNSAKVQKGETVSLTYEVPYDYESLVAACVDSKGHYYVKSFNIGTTSVNFKSNSTRAMTRGLNDYNDIDLSKIALGFQTSTLSYNAARTRYANLAASGRTIWVFGKMPIGKMTECGKYLIQAQGHLHGPLVVVHLSAQSIILIKTKKVS